MSITVIRIHVESGTKQEFDITKHNEFNKRYGHLLLTTQLSLAHSLIAEWNLKSGRSGYQYAIKSERMTAPR